jgi:hypothetical protein
MRRSTFRTSITALAALGIISSAVNVRGYVGFGYIWNTPQVPYYVNPQNLYVSAAQALAAVQAGASAWHDQSNADFQWVYAGQTNGSTVAYNGKNEVFFRSDTSGSTVGQTTWWASTSGALLDADIVFFQHHVFSTMSLGCSSGYYIENTATHEFGHALGLEHSAFETATMWPYTSQCETTRATLDGDDIAGIQALYPASSGSQVPAAPTQLSVAPNSADPTGSLIVSWAASTNVSGYRLERSNNGTSFGQIAQLGASTLSYADGGLSAGTSYYYRVRAFNNAGSSGYSNIASGQTQQVQSNTPPNVAISTPADGGSVPVGASTTFTGSASDAQDGNLTGSMTWSSNLDGPLGTGSGFSRVLSSGNHLITASVVDSGGLSRSTQVSTSVSGSVGSALPSMTAVGSKVKGAMKVSLTWTGFSTASVVVFRDGAAVMTTPNDGNEVDPVNRKGAASFVYKICTATGSICTAPVTVSFK